MPHANNPTPSPTEPNAEPHAIKLAEAAELVGTTVEALRLRVKRGTMNSVLVAGARGKKVAGVLRSELLEAFQEPNSPDQPEPHGQPNTPNAEPHGTQREPNGLEVELAKERALRQAQAEASSRALAVIQDRQLAPVLDQLRQDVLSARRDARTFSVLAVLAVGGIAWFAVNQVRQAASSTVQAQERTIRALEQVGDAQAKALEAATARAALEGELSATKAKAKQDAQAAQAALDAETKVRQQAEARLLAIGLAQRARTAVGVVIQWFR